MNFDNKGVFKIHISWLLFQAENSVFSKAEVTSPPTKKGVVEANQLLVQKPASHCSMS